MLFFLAAAAAAAASGAAAAATGVLGVVNKSIGEGLAALGVVGAEMLAAEVVVPAAKFGPRPGAAACISSKCSKHIILPAPTTMNNQRPSISLWGRASG